MKKIIKITGILVIIITIGISLISCANEDEDDVSLNLKIINNNDQPIVKVELHLFIYTEDWWDVNIIKGSSKTFKTTNTEYIDYEYGIVTVYYGEEFKEAVIRDLKFAVGKIITITLTDDGELELQ